MLFPTFEYMYWAKTAPDDTVLWNLAASGFMYTDPAILSPDLSRMELFSIKNYGSPEIRARVAERYGVPEDHVFPAAGTSLGIFLAMASALDKGDEVLVEEPAYEPLFKAPEALGLKVRRFSRPFEDGFRVDPDRVAKAMTPATRMIALSDLHNPSGRTLSTETRDALVQIAAKNRAILFVDEVYRDFLDSEKPLTAYAPGLPVIVASSLTKVYGMGGLRAGWMLAEPKVVEKAADVMNLLQVNDPYPVMPVIQAAFDKADQLRARAQDVSRAGLAEALAWLETRKDMPHTRPDGGLTVFPRLPEGLTGTAVSERLKREEATLVVPGRFFEDDRHIRIGVGGGPEVVREGLTRLGRVLDRMKARS